MENIKGEDYVHMMDWNDGVERGLGICTVLFLGLLGGLVAFEQVNAGGVARVLPSGDGIQMEYQGAEGTQQDVIPLYRAGTVRYFSAGIGLDERGADYPPFALKLVFTAGGKPFLTGVTVTIQGPKGTEKIVIPGERVDLPAGTYDISAAQADQTQALKSVKVERGKTTVVHLRWSEDRGVKLASPVN